MKKVEIKFPKIELGVGAQDMEKELEFIGMVEQVLETEEFQSMLVDIVNKAMAKTLDLVKLSYNRTDED